MKKFLSLVMALIMVMSLVTVASAADYTDAADIDKAQAVDVMSAVGVFQGSAGKFNPKAVLNRAEAAKLIAYLDLGEDVAEALPAVQSFSDVPATHWAAKFIAYCADEGYINGVGNGKFDPAGKLTGYQFGKLLLCVLGYDYKLESFTGANWSIAVAKLMQANDINKDVKAVPSAELTREDAAQYCLNALQATTVTYADKGTTITVGGVDIVTGAKAATPVTTGAYKSEFEAGTVELAEKLYEDDLVKVEADDAFGRPATKWTYEGKEVGTYADTAKFVWTTAMKKDAVTTALKGYVVKDAAGKTYKVNADTKLVGSVNLVGKTLNNSKSLAEQIAGFTGNGTRVEIFTKKDAIEEIHVITYGVAEVTKVVTDKDGNVTYTLKGSTTFTAKDFADPDKDDTVKAAAPMAEDDIVTYVKNGSVYYTYPTTSVTGVVSRVKAKDYVVVDGTQYPLATGVSVSVSKNEQELTIDQYGVVVDADDVKSESKVAYVAKVWSKQGNYGWETWVQVVTQSGEVVEKQLSTSNGAAVTEGSLYDFYVTSKDTASLLANTKGEATVVTGAEFDSDTKKINDGSHDYYFANDVKFVNVKSNGADIKVTTSTGMQKVSSIPTSINVYLVVDDADVKVVFVPAAAKGAVDKSSVLFLATTDIVDNALDKDNKDARVYKMYKDGEAVEVMVEDGAPLNASSAAGKFYTYSIDDTTGRYDLTAVSEQFSIYADGSDAANIDIKADKYVEDAYGNLYALAKDASFFDLTDNGLATLADIVDFVEANDDAALQVCVTFDDDEITALYIVKKADLA